MSTLLLAIIATAIAGARLDVTTGFYALLALIVAVLIAAITVAWVRGKRQLAELTRLGLQDDYPVRRDEIDPAIAAGVEYLLLRDGDYAAWNGFVVNAEFERIADRIAADIHWDSVRDMLDGDDAA